MFVGFAPPKSAARRTFLSEFAAVRATLIFYESGPRLADSLADMAAVFGGDRQAAVAREITKLHEQIVSMALADTAAWFAADSNRSRGEFVLVVAGKQADAGLEAEAERVLALLLGELPLKSAARLAAEITGVSKNMLYARALELRKDDD